ncbi:hypothetical protein KY349_05065 [Candidatus Woesearchaeota archaeon]|nr:hypothetical protein [Candidatus Woesearchaeota archaeon]
MLDKIMGKKKRKLPVPAKQASSKPVPAQRFNEMIDYYTAELKSRIDEIRKLKHENEMLIKTSIKNAARSDEHQLQVKKLQEEIRILQQKLSEKR